MRTQHIKSIIVDKINIATPEEWRSMAEQLYFQLEVAKKALEEIGDIHYGYDGDCGAIKFAYDALTEIRARDYALNDPRLAEMVKINQETGQYEGEK